MNSDEQLSPGTCLQLPTHSPQHGEIVQMLMPISWEGYVDSHPQVLQCPKFLPSSPRSRVQEVQHPGKVGSYNLAQPSCLHKCSYPKARKSRVQSSRYDKWLPLLAKPGPTIREAFQYGYRLLQEFQNPACEPPAESSTSQGSQATRNQFTNRTREWATRGYGTTLMSSLQINVLTIAWNDVCGSSWTMLIQMLRFNCFILCLVRFCVSPAGVLGDIWASHAAVQTPCPVNERSQITQNQERSAPRMCQGKVSCNLPELGRTWSSPGR